MFFEYALDRALAEQLVWRRGDTLWATENARVQTLADAAAVSGFDCAVVQLSFEDGFPALRGLRLREGFPSRFSTQRLTRLWQKKRRSAP